MQKSYVKIWQFQNKDVTLHHQTQTNKKFYHYDNFSNKNQNTIR